MKRKWIRIISLMVIIACVVISTNTILDIKDKKPVKIAEKEPVSINSLITNEMSSSKYTQKLDNSILYFMRRWGLKGATFALMRNDSLLYTKGYGMANDTLKCEANNLFRMASVSKLITATAIMKLIENGKLTLKSTVFGERGILSDSMFLDLRSKNLEKITVEHLMRHTAGFSSPLGDPAFNNENIARSLGKNLPLTEDDMVLYATKNRLLSRPGDQYRYSNLGYIILGKVVEKVTNINYETYVCDSILAPAGCYELSISQNFSEDRAAHEVKYYEVKEAEPVAAFDGSSQLRMKSDGGNNVTLLGSAGGWIASSAELMRFIASINGDDGKKDILSERSIKAMTYDSKRYKPMGWASVHGNEWLRSGSMAGTAALIKKQKNGYTWIFISNSSTWNGFKISNYISSTLTRAVAKVERWPDQDLFETKKLLAVDTLTIASNVID